MKGLILVLMHVAVSRKEGGDEEGAEQLNTLVVEGSGDENATVLRGTLVQRTQGANKAMKRWGFCHLLCVFACMMPGSFTVETEEEARVSHLHSSWTPGVV